MRKPLRRIFSILAVFGILLAAFIFAKFGRDYVRNNLKTLHFANGASLSRTVIEGAKAVFEIQQNNEKELLNNFLQIAAHFDSLDDIDLITQLESVGYPLVILAKTNGEIIYRSEITDARVANWLEEFYSLTAPVFEGKRSESVFGIDMDFPGSMRPKGISIRRRNRILTIFANIEPEPDMKSGMGYLIRDVAQESGISYIVLQNENGVVLASRGVNRVSKFTSDDFLQQVYAEERTKGRFANYNGHRVYEVVSKFPQMGQYSGVLRIGLSLREYEAVLTAISIPLAVIFFLLIAMTAFLIYNMILTKRLKKAEILTSGIKQKAGVVYLETNENGIISHLNDTARALFSEMENKIDSLQDIIGLKKWAKLHSSPRTKIISDIKVGESYLNIMSERLNPEDRYSGYYLIGFDTTELYDLKQTAESLHHLEGLSELTSTIAHDIRNPLNAISIASQKLDLITGDDQTKQKTLLKTLDREINNLNKMVEEFLSLSAPLSLRKDKTDLSAFLTGLYDFAKMLAHEKDIKILIKDEFDIKRAPLDKEKITRAIGNIIKNAIEVKTEEGEIEIRGENTEDQILISVKNTGKPIPNEILSKLFKPIASRKSSGYGLGLFSAYRIVRTHQGDIDVKSDENGTIFTIKLPLEDK